MNCVSVHTCVTGGAAAETDDAEMNGVGGSSFVNTTITSAEIHVYSGLGQRLT